MELIFKFHPRQTPDRNSWEVTRRGKNRFVHVLPRAPHVLSCWAVLGLRWSLLFLQSVPFRPQARIPYLLPESSPSTFRVRMSSSWLMMSLHPPPATCLSAGSGTWTYEVFGCEDFPLPCKIGAAFCFPSDSSAPRSTWSRMNMPPSFLSGMTSPCPQVDDALLGLREDYVMTCFLESVHTDQCSRHWSDV